MGLFDFDTPFTAYSPTWANPATGAVTPSLGVVSFDAENGTMFDGRTAPNTWVNPKGNRLWGDAGGVQAGSVANNFWSVLSGLGGSFLQFKISERQQKAEAAAADLARVRDIQMASVRASQPQTKASGMTPILIGVAALAAVGVAVMLARR